MPVSWDWLSAQHRLGQGRVSDPSQDAIGPAHVPDWWWEQQRARQAQTPGLIPQPQDVEALPLGSLGDPVSQLAFLAAPGLLRGAKGVVDAAATPGPSSLMRGGMLGSQRGNLGPPPMSATGEALPESMVRDETGQLQRLYHGTSRVFPDFEMAQSGSGAGGDLYGPGIYMTNSPHIAETYSELGPIPMETVAKDVPQIQAVLALRKQGMFLGDPNIRLEQTGMNEEEPLYTVLTKGWRPSNVRPVYADLKRPFTMDKRVGIDTYEALGSPSGYGSNTSGQQLYENLVSELGSKEAVNKHLQELGFDGITHIGGANTGGQAHRVYIAFSPDTVYPSVNVDALRGLSTQYPPR